MKIHDQIEQGSPEWFAIRRNRFTASDAGAFLIEKPSVRITVEEICKILTAEGIDHKPKDPKSKLEMLLPNRERYLDYTKGCKDARFNLICSKLGELSGESFPDFDSFAMKRGRELEPAAREYFEELTGHRVRQVGFVEHDSGLFGASPDGLLLNDTEGLECKSPMPATHVRYLLENKLPDDYLYQVHAGMAASGLKAWWFTSFCPNLPALVLRIERTGFTDEVEQGFLRLGAEYKRQKAIMAGLYEKSFTAK